MNNLCTLLSLQFHYWPNKALWIEYLDGLTLHFDPGQGSLFDNYSC